MIRLSILAVYNYHNEGAMPCWSKLPARAPLYDQASLSSTFSNNTLPNSALFICAQLNLSKLPLRRLVPSFEKLDSNLIPNSARFSAVIWNRTIRTHISKELTYFEKNRASCALLTQNSQVFSKTLLSREFIHSEN